MSTLTIQNGQKAGFAVRHDGSWMVVSYCEENVLRVFGLSPLRLERTIGISGTGVEFRLPYRVTFTSTNNILVCDHYADELKELSLTGVFVRYIYVKNPLAAALHGNMLAVGCSTKVQLLNWQRPSTVLWKFQGSGDVPIDACDICFTNDGSHIIVAEAFNRRLSVITAGGIFVRHVGVGVLGAYTKGVAVAASGEINVADQENKRVCVFPEDGGDMIRSWSSKGVGVVGQLDYPATLAIVDQQLFVMEGSGVLVQVFE